MKYLDMQALIISAGVNKLNYLHHESQLTRKYISSYIIQVYNMPDGPINSNIYCRKHINYNSTYRKKIAKYIFYMP